MRTPALNAALLALSFFRGRHYRDSLKRKRHGRIRFVPGDSKYQERVSQSRLYIKQARRLGFRGSVVKLLKETP